MPIKLVKKECTEEVLEYAVEYFPEEDRVSYWVLCDSNGVAIAKLSYEMKELIRKMESGEIKAQKGAVRKIMYKVLRPEVRQCYCGREIEMSYDEEGVVRCDCGKAFNTFGERIF